tara:strand:+ start:735 stop:1136 length:402 start_codon:yes stop_codon:yes gene_type:complete
MTTTFGTNTKPIKKMAKVQCLSLVDLGNTGNLNTLRQTMELRTQVTITGGPKRCTNQNMEEYAFGSDHGNYNTIWKLEFEYEQSQVFGAEFESLMRDLDFIPIEYEIEETAILKKPCFITEDTQQKNIYFQYI